jgi:hypothetical protein
MLTALARAKAVAVGRAQPTKTLRHVHLSERPLVLVAAQLAGEACAPLAALVGDDRAKPRLVFVSEPRNRSQRFEFAADLAATVLPYIDQQCVAEDCVAEARVAEARDAEARVAEHGDDEQRDRPPEPYPDAPQLIVPNLSTVAFLARLGRSTRFRKVSGEYAVPEAVPLLGHWLSYFAERAQVPPSSLLLPMTAALADHWATGQSAVEDANLGALLGWIDPPGAMTGRDAALLFEDPLRCPPAGPATDPGFDNEVLAPILDAVREATLAGDGLRLARAQAALDGALRSQLEPTWAFTWQARDVLRALPEAPHGERRWTDDRRSFSGRVAWLRGGGGPQPRRDSAMAAARRLARLEREQQRLAAERAYDDPLVMAEYRMTGEAFAGTVAAADPERVVNPSGKRAVLRPEIIVATEDPVLFEPGDVLRSPARPAQKARVTEIAAQQGRTVVTFELEGGMGRRLTPEPGSVPAEGEAITYTSLTTGFQQHPKFPDAQDTPWTHGGPPPAYVPSDEHIPSDEHRGLPLDQFSPEAYQPTDADASEDWS